MRLANFSFISYTAEVVLTRVMAPAVIEGYSFAFREASCIGKPV